MHPVISIRRLRISQSARVATTRVQRTRTAWSKTKFNVIPGSVDAIAARTHFARSVAARMAIVHPGCALSSCFSPVQSTASRIKWSTVEFHRNAHPGGLTLRPLFLCAPTGPQSLTVCGPTVNVTVLITMMYVYRLQVGESNPRVEIHTAARDICTRVNQANAREA